MRRDLIIGILVSLGLHYGVIVLGSRPHAKAPAKPPEQLIKIVQFTPPPIPPDETPPEEEGDPNANPTNLAPPSLNDVPSAVIPPDAFTTTLEPPPPDTSKLAVASISIPKGNFNTFQGARLFSIKDLDEQPFPQSRAQPIYPTEMRREGISGSATIYFVVDSNGNIQNVHAISSTRVDFEQPAIEAVQKWKYKPGRKGGKAVATRMQIPITFNLNDSDDN